MNLYKLVTILFVFTFLISAGMLRWVVIAQEDTTPPSTPIGLSAAPGDGEVVLNWDANTESDLNNYAMQYKASSDSTWINVTGISKNNPTRTQTGLANDTSYDFRVRARDITGNLSSFSSSVSTAPLSGLPSPSTPSSSELYTGVSSRLHNTSAVAGTINEHSNHPKLKLVSTMATWATLEPSNNSFNWTQMNANVFDARVNNYKIIFRIMAGQRAPSWLYSNGVQKIQLLVTDPNASDFCDLVDVPVPWDANLKIHYTDLMTEVGGWLNESDGAGGVKGDHIYFVPIAMPTFQGSEMVIAYGRSGLNCSGYGDSIVFNKAQWNAISTESGRRASVEQAWKDAIDIHMQELSVDSAVAYGAIFGDRQAAADDIASAKIAQYPSRLWSMYTNLRPKVNTDGSLSPWKNFCGFCHNVIQTAISTYQSAGVDPRIGFQTAGTSINNTAEKFQFAAEEGLTTYGMRFFETQPRAVDNNESYLLASANNLQDRLGASDAETAGVGSTDTSETDSATTGTELSGGLDGTSGTDSTPIFLGGIQISANRQSQTSDLLFQINNILIQIRQLGENPQFILPGGFYYLRDLTIGEQGYDVIALQNFLVLKNVGLSARALNSVLQQGIPKGFFGGLTRAALAEYQATNNIFPSVGFFGPITRRHISTP